MDADIQERKLDKNFVLLDLDRDGCISQSDMEAAAQRFLDQIGKDITSPAGTEVANALGAPAGAEFRSVIAAIWRAVDPQGKGQLTKDEYAAAMTDLTGSGQLPELLRAVHRSFFDLADTNNDGVLSREEFGRLYGNSGLTPTEVDELFRRLDTDHSGTLSVDELANAAVDFYQSSDPKSPANWLNGFF
ncbi:EF-hand domain-containing protein [Streptomyces celluloflavus]|uniref:EF-hand domain-containing protein n=1 Tax=Streptomyces celluloflavus TaxID=58344 RepID=UPI0036CE2C66